jgi:hypothetical protein
LLETCWNAIDTNGIRRVPTDGPEGLNTAVRASGEIPLGMGKLKLIGWVRKTCLVQ